MRSLRRLAGILLVTLSLLAGFLGSPAQAAPAASQQQTLAAIKALLPADAGERVAGALDPIDPDAYECRPTELQDWMLGQYAQMSETDLEFLTATYADMWPSLDVAYTADPADPFYRVTVDAQRLGKTFTKAQQFWTPNDPALRMVAIHSEAILDAGRMQPVVAQVLGLDDATAAQLTALMAAYVANSPGLQHGASPLLSFNAFTVDERIYPGRPPLVALGDGMQEAYRDLGYGDVAGPFVLAHEIAHSVQIANGRYDVLPATPQETRYLELEADAMAAYFSSHPRGLSMQAKRVAQFAKVAYSVGDCSFEYLGHHGTPNQRLRAAEWAADLALTSRPRGKVLTYPAFDAAFLAHYPTLVAPDA